MFLTENLKITLSASIAFDQSNAKELSQNPYTNRKSKYARQKILYICSFSVGEFFTLAKMKLCCIQ